MGIIFRLIYGYLLLKDWYPKMNRIRFSLLSDMAVSYFLWGANVLQTNLHQI